MGDDYIQSVLEASQAEFEGSLAKGGFKRGTARPLHPGLVALFKVLENDPILIEATLAWVKQKQAEVALATVTTLRGEEWVKQQAKAMAEAEPE